MDIEFHFLKNTDLKNRTRLREFIQGITKREKTKINELTYIFCSDQYIRQINKRFLNHNFETDIITFDLSTDKTYKKGEIYISIDRIKSNSIDYNQFIYKELHRVIFHGVLHLCGYKDKSKSDSLEMRKMEDFYLSRYFKK